MVSSQCIVLVAPFDMTTTWSVEDVTKELRDIAALLQVRNGDDAFGAGLINSVAAKLNLVPRVRAHEAMQLYTTLQGCNIPTALKNTLHAAIDKAVAEECDTSDKNSAQVLTQGTQKLCSLHNYLTSDDWDILLSEHANYWELIGVVASRMRSIGIKSLHEDTKRWVVALLLWLALKRSNGKMPPYLWIYCLVQDIYSCFHSTATLSTTAGSAATGSDSKPSELSSLKVYPLSPADLGDDWIKQAYGKTKPVAPPELQGLSNLALNHVPVRSSSSLLTDADRLQLQQRNKKSTIHINSGRKTPVISLCSPPASDGDTMAILDQMVKQFQKQKAASCGALALDDSEPSTPARGALSLLDGAGPLGSEARAQDTTVVKPRPRADHADQGSKLRVPLVGSPAGPEPAEPAPSRPALPAESAVESPSDGHPAKDDSLEAFEQRAYDAILKGSKVGGSKKRPAAASAAAAASARTLKRPAAAALAASGHEIKLGCNSCRGCVNGCSNCRRPDFQGIRLHGRAAYDQHRKKKGMPIDIK